MVCLERMDWESDTEMSGSGTSREWNSPSEVGQIEYPPLIVNLGRTGIPEVQRILLEALDEKDTERAISVRKELALVLPEVADGLDSEGAASVGRMDTLAKQFRDALRVKKPAEEDVDKGEVEAPTFEGIIDLSALQALAGELEDASREVLSSANEELAMMELLMEKTERMVEKQHETHQCPSPLEEGEIDPEGAFAGRLASGDTEMLEMWDTMHQKLWGKVANENQ
ncbi:hypothetical protein CYLTODRAFT_451290 [Cylindrobasidium torrendii FP15055 ss-10]|uniref:Uncharacterized protein n=1 Tax=Cylindrobasidium torrendii FP15055 ss-10 TaxID=1314674 RepID=A0A0D7BK55_9AGAR|nr:hypothetical protein CYLTODRAFT_451290 [Cylindrobasidium torrendii FP15055 ss-10]